MIHIAAFLISIACCLTYSLKFGGSPEKAASLSLVAATFLTFLAIMFVPRLARFHGLAPAVVVIDAALLLALTGIALLANRLWTIVLAGLQLSTVIVHLSKALYPALPTASYGIFAQFWAWPMLLTAASGTYRHRLRIRQFGEERDWRPLWLPSVQPGSRT